MQWTRQFKKWFELIFKYLGWVDESGVLAKVQVRHTNSKLQKVFHRTFFKTQSHVFVWWSNSSTIEWLFDLWVYNPSMNKSVLLRIFILPNFHSQEELTTAGSDS